MFSKAIQWLAPWWASLLDKKVYVAVTFGSTMLVAISWGWHFYDNYQAAKREDRLKIEITELKSDVSRITKGNQLLNESRINELKADRDTAFARLQRLQELINKR